MPSLSVSGLGKALKFSLHSFLRESEEGPLNTCVDVYDLENSQCSVYNAFHFNSTGVICRGVLELNSTLLGRCSVPELHIWPIFNRSLWYCVVNNTDKGQYSIEY